MNVAAILAQGAGMLQSLVVLRLLDPAVYGIWVGLMIVLSYGAYAQLGLEYGLGLLLPLYRGRNEPARVDALTDTVFGSWSIVTALVSTGVIVFALVTNPTNELVRWGLITVAIQLLLNQQAGFFARWHGAALMDFTTPSLFVVVQSLVSLAVVVPLVYIFGLKGLMLGVLIAAGIVCAGWYAKSPYRFHRLWTRELLRDALSVGFPVMLVTFAGGLIQTIDRLIILSFLGATALGYYGVTTLASGFLYGLLAQAGGAIAPHIGHELGRSGYESGGLRRFLIAPTIAFAYVSTVMIALLLVGIPPIVRLLLPKYVPGLPAFVLFVPGFFFLAIILTANNILNNIFVVRREKRFMLYIQAIAIAVEAALAVSFIRLGFGIRGVALASTASYAVYGLMILVGATRHVIPGNQNQLQFIALVFLPAIAAIPVLGALFLVGTEARHNHPLGAAIVQSAVVLLCAVLGLPWLQAKIGTNFTVSSIAQAFRAKVRPAQ